MTVYVDTMRAKYGRMVMCHMVADSTAELLAMADAIGVARRWIQDAGEPTEHFDIALSKRALAVRNGAIEIDLHGIGAFMRRRFTKAGAEGEGRGTRT